MSRVTWILVLLLACLAGRAWALPAVGQEAPAFALRDLSEPPKKVASQDIFLGKTTLLSFFTTWCKPCEQEIPQLRSLAERERKRGFQVVLISLDQGGAEEIRAFVREASGQGLAVLWDEDGDAMGLYGVFSLPTNVVVGPAGKVLMAWQGYQEDKLRKLEGLVEELPGTEGGGRAAPQ
jgi:peroxiredoxin